MADNKGEQQSSIWSLPKFYFEVRFGSEVMQFQEVSGLNTETQTIEYRAGKSNEFSTVKMPGIRKLHNVTLKKGVFKADNKFQDWFNQIKLNAIKRETVTVSLLDEKGSVTMTWTLTNAWPTKITGTDLKSNSNEVAVETIELACDQITVAASSK